MMKIRALVLLSGGLDSMLAVKILQEQDIEVTGICFKSNFFSCEKAREAVKSLGVELKVVDISEEMLETVKNPASGYGKNLNPCIDCHALMMRKAGEYLTPSPLLIRTSPPTPLLVRRGGKEGRGLGDGEYDFIATGEVLGERPFSQNKQALVRVQNLAGVEVLRPLSAKLLFETIYEKAGLVNRNKLLDISGRSRARQMELAKKYGINQYPSPAGGCLLTDQEFSARLMKILELWPECGTNDVELLKNGRMFWIAPTPGPSPAPGVAGEGNKKILVVVGRNKEECENLEKIKQTGDITIELVDEMGPATIIRNPKSQIQNFLEVEIPKELKMSELKLNEEKSEEEIIDLAALLTGYYATKARGKKVKLEVRS